jgi:3-phosphoshikimate 1-carboxyvinyltransferase
MNLTLSPRGLRSGPLRPPISKSDAHRALVLAHALGRAAPALGPESERPYDVRVVAAALARFGEAGSLEIDCRDGGAPLRLLLAQAALRPGETRLTGSARLAARPHATLLDALRRGLGPAGLQLDVGDPWPIVVRGAAPVGEVGFTVVAEQSSQPLSALLLLATALAARGHATTIEAVGPIASEGYLAMTLKWLRAAGVRVEVEGGCHRVLAVQKAGPLPAVPSDWSSIGYLLLAAWASGGWVEKVDVDASHPDRAIIAQLASVGIIVELADGRARVHGQAHGGLDFDVASAPDLAPTLAALACVLPSPSRLSAIAILRLKESDRIAGVQALVEAAGGRARIDGDALTIEPATSIPERLRFAARGDHRLVMAAAVLAVLARRPLVLEGAEHVEKSFPTFFAQLGRLGVCIAPCSLSGQETPEDAD